MVPTKNDLIRDALAELPASFDAAGRAVALAYQYAIAAPDEHLAEAWRDLEFAHLAERGESP